MVVEDLQALPRSPLVVAEGSTLPAAAVHDHARAVWLLPTPAFQRACLAKRCLEHGQRRLFHLPTDTIEREAKEAGVRTLASDGSLSVGATVDAVEKLFANALAEGPRAQARDERRALLRGANQAIVAQVRGYYARPWAEGDPDVEARPFLCECGDPTCDSSVEAAIGIAAAAPGVALGHG